MGFNVDQVKSLVKEMGITSEVIGKTDRLGKLRGQEIERFLKSIQSEEGRRKLIEEGLLDSRIDPVDPIRLIQYVIIDDDSDMLEGQESNFVRTNHMEGFGCTDAIRAGKILNDDETFYLNNLMGKKSAGVLTHPCLW